MGVGSLVEDEKSSVNALGDGACGSGERQVNRVGVTTIISAGFKEREIGLTAQTVRHRQTRNAGAHNGDFHGEGAGNTAAKGL